MSFNLVLHSTDAISYENSVASYYVNWNNFYEDDPYCKYNVSFSFISDIDNGLTAGHIFSLNVESLGTTFQTIEGTNYSTSSNNSLALGFVEVAELHSASNRRLEALHSYNPPITITGRPQSNIIQIALRDFNKAKTFPATPDYMLFLRFEKL
jgi:hypothetical protein